MIKTLSIPSTLTSSLVVNPDTNMIYASNPSYPYQVIVIQGTTPIQDTQDLINTVNSMNLSQGITNSLDAKLNAAISYLNSSDNASAKDSLNAFINEANAQAGKNLTTDQAIQLTTDAQNIINALS